MFNIRPSMGTFFAGPPQLPSYFTSSHFALLTLFLSSLSSSYVSFSIKLPFIVCFVQPKRRNLSLEPARGETPRGVSLMFLSRCLEFNLESYYFTAASQLPRSSGKKRSNTLVYITNANGNVKQRKADRLWEQPFGFFSAVGTDVNHLYYMPFMKYE